MCFCFDGESAVAAYRPDDCRERLPVASAPASRPDAYSGEPPSRALPVRPNATGRIQPLLAVAAD